MTPHLMAYFGACSLLFWGLGFVEIVLIYLLSTQQNTQGKKRQGVPN